MICIPISQLQFPVLSSVIFCYTVNQTFMADYRFLLEKKKKVKEDDEEEEGEAKWICS